MVQRLFRDTLEKLRGFTFRKYVLLLFYDLFSIVKSIIFAHLLFIYYSLRKHIRILSKNRVHFISK